MINLADWLNQLTPHTLFRLPHLPLHSEALWGALRGLVKSLLNFQNQPNLVKTHGTHSGFISKQAKNGCAGLIGSPKCSYCSLRWRVAMHKKPGKSNERVLPLAHTRIQENLSVVCQGRVKGEWGSGGSPRLTLWPRRLFDEALENRAAYQWAIKGLLGY